jgi:hypothetical protein
VDYGNVNSQSSPKCPRVLDNAPYHSVKMNKPPTLGSKKVEQWFERRKI